MCHWLRDITLSSNALHLFDKMIKDKENCQYVQVMAVIKIGLWAENVGNIYTDCMS